MSGFPPGFVWGAATAAYQIEGGHDLDGRAPSVWDTFCRRKGAVYQSHTGDVATDHVHRYPEDVGIMAGLGLHAYRFSVSWPRVVPGLGAVNEAGLGFYDRLVDALLRAGVTPYCTLFHWDYPQHLFERGGWLSPESPQWFADYAALLARRLGDRVNHWITLNEPGIFLTLGHLDGSHAPGIKLSPAEYVLALKHAMLAHGRAVSALRAEGGAGAWVSYAPHCIVSIPASESPEDVAAAREATWGRAAHARGPWQQRLFLDAPLLGEWPTDIEEALTGRALGLTDAERETIHQPLDGLCLNFYTGELVKAGADGAPVVVPDPPGMPRTLFDWPIRPEGLYWTLRFHAERYGLPLVVTENGLSCMDWVALDGGVHDPQRIDFLARYLREMRRAIAEGVDVRGYFHWSLLDNFEWADGYRHRFGLVHVDYATGTRTLKDSAHWYAEVVRTNGASLPA